MKKICFLIIFIIFIILFYLKINYTTNVIETKVINKVQAKKDIIIENTEKEEKIINNATQINVIDGIVRSSDDFFQNIKDTNDVENSPEEVVNNIQVSSDFNVATFYDENAFENGYLKAYPLFGVEYAFLKIDKIKVNAPILFGATDEIILHGIGHDSGSYFPGENGTIIMCGHNYMNNFNRLGELVNGDILEIQTNYGDFLYKIYDFQIVLENESYKLPVQKDEEIIMLYTCYPFNSVGHTEYRYVIYGRKI